MDFKFTKGNWVFKINPISEKQMFVRSGNTFICRLNDGDFDNVGEMGYNALLISKAPELLEELKHCVEVIKLSSTAISREICERVEQLIKEATTLPND